MAVQQLIWCPSKFHVVQSRNNQRPDVDNHRVAKNRSKKPDEFDMAVLCRRLKPTPLFELKSWTKSPHQQCHWLRQDQLHRSIPGPDTMLLYYWKRVPAWRFCCRREYH